MTGQCDCLPGITGLKCNQVIPGHFFPAIDHLRLEGESAVSIPPSVVTLASGEGETFTGTGHYRVVEGEGISVFGTLEFPQSGLYEILFRYNLVGALVWDSVTVTIRAGPEEGVGWQTVRMNYQLVIPASNTPPGPWGQGSSGHRHFVLELDVCTLSY